jgi:hypothetical protein
MCACIHRINAYMCISIYIYIIFLKEKKWDTHARIMRRKLEPFIRSKMCVSVFEERKENRIYMHGRGDTFSISPNTYSETTLTEQRISCASSYDDWLLDHVRRRDTPAVPDETFRQEQVRLSFSVAFGKEVMLDHMHRGISAGLLAPHIPWYCSWYGLNGSEGMEPEIFGLPWRTRLAYSFLGALLISIAILFAYPPRSLYLYNSTT